jgi:hypothetical protein
LSNEITFTVGVAYKITIALTLNSGEYPTIALNPQTLSIRKLANGLNEIYFTAEGENSILCLQNDTVSDWSALISIKQVGIGGVGIGTETPDENAILDLTSTTKAFLLPRMTTVQKLAIPSPTGGMMVFDITLMKLCVYGAAGWEIITSI